MKSISIDNEQISASRNSIQWQFTLYSKSVRPQFLVLRDAIQNKIPLESMNPGDFLGSSITFKDHDFEMNEYSLSKIRESIGCHSNIQAERLSNMFGSNEIEVLSNGQGILQKTEPVYSPQPLIDALCCLSCQPGLILSIIGSQSSPKYGYYTVWLNLSGVWTQVPVDDHVPVISDLKQILFIKPSLQSPEIWPIIIEKAIAKAYGGYQQLQYSHEEDLDSFLKDLTGIYPEKVYMDTFRTEGRSIDPSNFISMVKEFDQRGFPCYLSPSDTCSLGFPPSARLAIVKLIKANNGYLLQLRSALTYPQFGGVLSASGGKWSKQLMDTLQFDQQDFHHFWLLPQEIISSFESLTVVRCNMHCSFNSRPLTFENQINIRRKALRVRVREKGEYIFFVDQQDRKFFPEGQFSYSRVTLTIGKLKNDKFKFIAHAASLNTKSSFIRKELAGGEYYILVEIENDPSNQYRSDQDPASYRGSEICMFSTYGPRTCQIEALELEGNVLLFDLALAETWAFYTSKKNGGQKISEFELRGDVGMSAYIELKQLDAAGSRIYSLVNISGKQISCRVDILFEDSNPHQCGTEVLWNGGVIAQSKDINLSHGQSTIFILRSNLNSQDGDHPQFSLDFGNVWIGGPIDSQINSDLDMVYGALINYEFEDLMSIMDYDKQEGIPLFEGSYIFSESSQQLQKMAIYQKGASPQKQPSKANDKKLGLITKQQIPQNPKLPISEPFPPPAIIPNPVSSSESKINSPRLRPQTPKKRKTMMNDEEAVIKELEKALNNPPNLSAYSTGQLLQTERTPLSHRGPQSQRNTVIIAQPTSGRKQQLCAPQKTPQSILKKSTSTASVELMPSNLQNNKRKSVRIANSRTVRTFTPKVNEDESIIIDSTPQRFKSRSPEIVKQGGARNRAHKMSNIHSISTNAPEVRKAKRLGKPQIVQRHQKQNLPSHISGEQVKSMQKTRFSTGESQLNNYNN